MKKLIMLTLAILLVLFSVVACAKNEATVVVTSTKMLDNVAKVEKETPEKETPEKIKITVESPMTLSNTSIPNGKEEELRLVMVEGSYNEAWATGAIMGRIWEGYYIIEVVDQLGSVIAQTDLREVFKQKLLFTNFFEIQFDDYNNDGDLDFTIGQYGSSNGNDYKLFTLRQDGKVDELLIKDYPYLFITNTTGYYSTKLSKVDHTTFKKSYYNNAGGKHFEDTFQWDGEQFELIESKEVAN